MNDFDKKLSEHGYYPLRAKTITALLVQMGYKCDLRCSHCYVDASPDRTEEMPLRVIDRILEILAENNGIRTLDITGGAPELNPHFKYLVKSATALGRKVMVRSNLTVFSEPGMGDLPEFFAENRVEIFASLPSCTEEVTDKQRGKGTYKKVISALRRLNILGYAGGSFLELNLTFNPPRASIAPDRQILEISYKDKLMEMHDITFNNLVVMGNVPVGRLRRSMTEDEYETYIDQLREKFNPGNLKDLLCRELLCVSHSGGLHDCGFQQIQGIPVKSAHSHIDDFDYEALSKREIASSQICFACTAGAGIGCSCGKITFNSN